MPEPILYPEVQSAPRSWFLSPVRILRRSLIGILGAFFFVNGLFKGGLTVLVIAVLWGDSWVLHHSWMSLVIALIVGGAIIPILLAILYQREQNITHNQRLKPQWRMRYFEPSEISETRQRK